MPLGRVVLVIALLGATVASFAIAERLKLERSPIAGPSVTKIFSPVCECAPAEIRFRLQRRDRLTIAIVDSGDGVVRTLLRRRRFAPGPVRVAWDGRDDGGDVVPEGVYRPRVHFDDRDRTIVLENRIQVDTTTPGIEPIGVRPRRFSPDGDGRRDGIAVRYRLSEPGRALLIVNGVRRVRGRARVKTPGQLQWYGRVDGRPLPAGTYRLQIVGVDLAGNRTPRVPAGPVTIRYVEVAPSILRTRVGESFGVSVATDAASYDWRFAGRSGTASFRRLRLRARRPGRFALVVEANGHTDRATVTVARKPAPRRRRAR
ncbi:MAG: hypothetical protein ABR521_05440 [Gaiellaceae bacterium]